MSCLSIKHSAKLSPGALLPNNIRPQARIVSADAPQLTAHVGTPMRCSPAHQLPAEQLGSCPGLLKASGMRAPAPASIHTPCLGHHWLPGAHFGASMQTRHEGSAAGAFFGRLRVAAGLVFCAVVAVGVPHLLHCIACCWVVDLGIDNNLDGLVQVSSCRTGPASSSCTARPLAGATRSTCCLPGLTMVCPGRCSTV